MAKKTKNEFHLDVAYKSQLDNVYAPFITCYPTSMAMAIEYCLALVDRSKKDIGCQYDIQLEDYLDKIAMSEEIKTWLKKNVGRLGTWIYKYKPMTIAYVQEYIFNKLMLKYQFMCKFRANVSFDELCDLIYKQNLPQVLHGNFSKNTDVKGHIVCATGFKREEKKIIVNDPFGNAHIKYLDRNGHDIEYNFDDYFIKNKKNKTTWVSSISRS